MKFVFIIIFAFTIVTAQSNINELLKSVEKLPDSSKVIKLTDFCWNNRNQNPRLALSSGQEGLKISEQIGDKRLQAKSFNMIGVVYRNLADYDKAISAYRNALRLSEEVKDSIQIAFSKNNIGGIYRLQGNYNVSLKYILDALKIFERHNNKDGISFCAVNIGVIYWRQQNHQKALEYLNYTVKIREEINDKPGGALALNLIAEVYFDLNEIETALKYYKIAEKEYEEMNNKKGLAAIWGGLGGVYYQKKDYKLALQYRLRALDLANKINYIEGQIASYNNLGRIYAKLNNYNYADINFNKAFELARKTEIIDSQLECYKYLAEYNEIKKDYKQSLLYIRKYHALRDSVLNFQNSSFISQMEAEYQVEKIKRQNDILVKDLELNIRQRNFSLIIAALVIVFASGLFYLNRLKKKANLELHELNATKDKLFGIIAHDLRSPFNTMFGFTSIIKDDYSQLSDDERISVINNIEKSGKQAFQLLENLLCWSLTQTNRIEFNKHEVDLHEIILETFFLLKETANNKQITLTSTVEDKCIAFCDEEMIKTVLRNLITNAIKFSFPSNEVSISVEDQNNFRKICVKDNGVGITGELRDKIFSMENVCTSKGTSGETGTGLGLIICKDFVEKNSGRIWVESELGEGSKFFFTVPITQ
jgi:signal transduction histidine kinase